MTISEEKASQPQDNERPIPETAVSAPNAKNSWWTRKRLAIVAGVAIAATAAGVGGGIAAAGSSKKTLSPAAQLAADHDNPVKFATDVARDLLKQDTDILVPYVSSEYESTYGSTSDQLTTVLDRIGVRIANTNTAHLVLESPSYIAGLTPASHGGGNAVFDGVKVYTTGAPATGTIDILLDATSGQLQISDVELHTYSS